MGYRPALDGLRAVAIVSVMAYHFVGSTGWVEGGWLGVNLFFVLSGFLITRLLIEEHHRAGAIDSRQFYRRRFARLMPGYFALLGVVVLVSAVSPMLGRAEQLRVGASSSFFYVTNVVASNQGFGVLGPFAHLWSLALEEQFYLLWPLALIVLLRRVPVVHAGVYTALAAAGVFAWVAVRSFGGGVEETALYVRTDGQGMGFLLAGCATALLVSPRGAVAKARWVHPVGRFGALALLPIVPLWLFVDHDETPYYYRGVLAVVAALMVVVLLAALADGPFSRFLARPHLVWIGTRSYSLYLWHYVVLVGVDWLNHEYDLQMPLALQVALAVALSFLFAELSYRWVEQPMRQRFATPRPAPEAQVMSSMR